MEALVGKLLEYGTTPALLVLAALVGVLIKKIDENGKKVEENGKRDEERAEKLQGAMAAQMNQMEEHFEERFAIADKRIDELSTRVSCVERDYLPREEHYREFSGWRAEINRLYDLMVNLFKEKNDK